MDEASVARDRYSVGAVALHWLIAAAIVFEIGLGLAMTGPRNPATFASYQFHKSVGIVILLLTCVRIAWRLLHKPPALAASLSTLERAAARLVHGGFYLLLLALPLTGWLMVSSAKVHVPTKLFSTVPWPAFPGTSSLIGQARTSAHDLSESSHTVLAYIAIALVLLHVAGALKHHFFDRDDEIARMIPLRSSALTGATMTAVVAGALLFAAGYSMLGQSGQARQSLAGSEQTGAPDSLPLKPDGMVGAAGVATPAETGAPVSLEATAVPSPEPSRSSDWTVDYRKSTLGFGVAWNGENVAGRFGQWSATIHFDPDALDRSNVDVSIGMNSATASQTEVTEALPGADWFSVPKFPKARFVSDRFRKVSEGHYLASGDLTLRGVHRRIDLPFQLQIDGDHARMTGAATIDRLQFGVGQGEWTSTGEVGGKVKVSIKIVANRKK